MERPLTKPSKRKRANAAREQEQQLHEYESDGLPIGGSLYSCLVPDGDPLLQRLIAAHGNDKINRDVITIATARALHWQLPGRELKRARMPV
jgi:hypothetical protein